LTSSKLKSQQQLGVSQQHLFNGSLARCVQVTDFGNHVHDTSMSTRQVQLLRHSLCILPSQGGSHSGFCKTSCINLWDDSGTCALSNSKKTTTAGMSNQHRHALPHFALQVQYMSMCTGQVLLCPPVKLRLSNTAHVRILTIYFAVLPHHDSMMVGGNVMAGLCC
jgi:hypothetical protein